MKNIAISLDAMRDPWRRLEKLRPDEIGLRLKRLTDIRHLVIDMDGVLYVGNQPMPCLAEFIAFLRRERIGFMLATNNRAARLSSMWTGWPAWVQISRPPRS